jgi:hypothetical protein
VKARNGRKLYRYTIECEVSRSVLPSDVQALGQGPQGRAQTGQLLDVDRAEVLEALLTGGGQDESHLTLVGRVGSALHETGGLRPVDELDRTVMTEEQMIGHVADGGPQRTGTATGAAFAVRFTVTANREQELVLRGRQTRGRRLLFAPAQEPPQSGAELEESRVLGITEAPRHGPIVTRTPVTAGGLR